ncbi:hypothetical protein D3C79_1112880 [compost metagenome]
MRSSSAGSNASAKARVTAVIMFTQRICSGVMGSVSPRRMAVNRTKAWAPLVGRMKRMDFFRLS